MAQPSGSLPPNLTLERDERLLWASPEGGTAGYPQWAITLIVLGYFFVLGPITGAVVVIASAVLPEAVGLAPVAILSVLAQLGALGALIAVWAVPRLRLSHFLTSKRLISRGLFGGLTEARLDRVRGVERLVVHYRTRYGVREVVTDRLCFDLGGPQMLFGPSKDIERVLDLMEHGVLTRWVDLSALPALALPGLPAPPAPAEEQESFFLAATSRTGSDGYGPLFIGPRVIVRITEELSFHVLGRLYTTLAGAVDGEAAELLFFEILRMGTTGHFVEMPRGATKITVAPPGVLLAGPEDRRVELTLPPSALSRLAAYLKRPIPEVSEPLSMSARLLGKPSPAAAAPIATGSEGPRAAASPVASRVAPRIETPDLLDPTATTSEARTLDVRSLDGSARTELAAALRSDRRLLFAPSRFVAEHRVLVLVAALTPLITAVALGTRFGTPCSPHQEWAWLVIAAVGLMGPALLVTALARHLWRARSAPFPVGLYVLPRDVIAAKGPVVRVVPLAQVAAIGTSRPLPLASHAELTLWIEGEPAERCFVPGAEIEALGARLEEAQKAAQAPLERGSRSGDPLEALRRTKAFEGAPRAAPGNPWTLTVAIAALLALVMAGIAYPIRNRLSDAAALAAAGSDVDALQCYVDAGGLEAERVSREAIPHAAYLTAHAAGTVPALTSYIDAHPGAPDTPTAIAEREALAWSSASRDVWSLSAFVAAYPTSVHVAEARAMLPAMALAAAREADDVASLASVVRTYPGTPEAAEATRLRRARFDAALAALGARGSRREVMAFFTRLFTFFEANDGAEVRVRFRAPSAEALAALDAMLDSENRRDVEPIAPSFSPRASRAREALVYDRVRLGLAEIVPRDVLPLAHATPLPDRHSDAEISARIAAEAELGASPEELDALLEQYRQSNDPTATGPEIRIDYQVIPSGDIYTLETVSVFGDPIYGDRPPDRYFAGFRVDFSVEMRLADEPDRPVLRFSVSPPSTLAVSRGEDDPSASSIYEQLASAAFDELGTELSRALYGQ